MAAAGTRLSGRRARSELHARLEGRRTEIEDTLLARMAAIADPSEVSDPAYVERLHAAVSAALDYGLETIERGGEGEPPVPVELLAQARTAARNRVGLDTVLRRYIAGYSLLGYFMIEEAGREDLMKAGELQRLLGSQAALFDRLLAEVGEEHTRESEARRLPSARREAERIERLLGGEALDTSELEYDFDSHHVGVVGIGGDTARVLREVARAVDCRLMLVERPEGSAWAWLGSRHPLDPAESGEALAEIGAGMCTFAFGTCGEGRVGWRLTHRQALAALPVAQRSEEPVTLYADVALLASVVRDELLATSLRQLYIEPLAAMPGGGLELRETLRAYLTTNGNVSSTAAALNVDRRTVARRIQAIEEVISRRIASNAPELAAAIRIWDMDSP